MILQRASLVLFLFAVLACASAAAPETSAARPHSAAPARVELPEGDFVELPDLGALSSGGMRLVIERWGADRRTLEEFYDLDVSPTRRARLADLHTAWLAGLEGIDFAGLARADQIDYLLLQGELRHRLRELALEAESLGEVEVALPFATQLIALHEARRDLQPVEPAAAAQQLTDLVAVVAAAREVVAPAGPEVAEGKQGLEPFEARRAASATDQLRRSLREWYEFHAGYEPLFFWWVSEPWKALDGDLRDHAKFLREDIAGIEDEDAIVGSPIGAEALQAELEHEWIPYTPEELVAIAEREMAWCRARMLEASAQLGYGDDWRAALEHVKGLYVPPGEQTALVVALAREAEQYLIDNDLVTVPELARRTWLMEMMSPERQKVNPFFLGGDRVIVSYPTDAMSQEDKLMSLRANNEHFSRAVVHHELIPGHRLQHFMQARYNTQRRPFGTPFWGEGWALYWELSLWDRGFARGPEDRIGMLFWRMHRCARIRFSLSFHLGTMTPQECVDLLVDEVGHERASAEGEVRRSFEGGYSPLYQCAYMLGGLQLRALHAELVGTGQLSERQFHDAVLQQNSMPIELVRAALGTQLLSPAQQSTWRFAGEFGQ